MKPILPKISFVTGLLLTVIFSCGITALGQLAEIENRLPKSVPLEVEFKHYDKEVISFKFGDVRRFNSTTNEELGGQSDPSILAGESYTFKVPDNYIKGWDLRKTNRTFVEPRAGKLEHGLTNFGDGTGLEPGGTPWRTPLKKL